MSETLPEQAMGWYGVAADDAFRAGLLEAARMAEERARKHEHDQYDMDIAGRSAKRSALLGIAAALRARAEARGDD